MKGILFVLLLAVGAESVRGQTAETNAAPAVPVASTPTAAQVADFQKRYQQGLALEKQGDLAGARIIFEGILAEQPDAKGSLFEAGQISLSLGEPQKADAYLDKLHTLVPNFAPAIEALIEASEAQHHEVKADRLVREFRSLRDSGTAVHLRDPLSFVREDIHLDANSEIVISQFFDYTSAPFYALRAELFGAGQQRQRIVLLKYDPDGTAEVRAKDPKLARDEVFLLAEPYFNGEKMNKIDVYQELLSAPDYDKARTMLLLILTHPPKPIYSTPVDASAQ